MGLKHDRHVARILVCWLVLMAWALVVPSEGIPAAIWSPGVVSASDPLYSCAGVISIPQSECEALVALWEQAGGSGWDDDCGWLQGDDPCAWHSASGSNGVVCEGGHVTALRQVDNNLQGVIPAEIGDLQHLVILSMGGNHLTGSIPDNIQNLVLLEELNLDGNDLSGSLPDALCALDQLQFLNLNGNQFAGEIPACLGDASYLVHLHLQDNQLEGSIPWTLGNLTMLESLRLDRNWLQGPLPDELGNLSALGVLAVGHNGLVGELPETLAALDQLELLDLGYNGLWTSSDAVRTFASARDPAWEETQTIAPANVRVTGLTTETVSLAWDAIPYTEDAGRYEVGVSEAPGGPYVVTAQTATKSETSLTVSGLSPGRMYYLAVRTYTAAHPPQQNAIWSPYGDEISVMLGADICDLVTDVPVSECQALVALYHRTEGADWAQRTGWTEATAVGDWFGVGVTDGHVRSLSLHGNGLAGSLPDELGDLSALQYLYLSHNQITGTIPSRLGELPDLRHLHLYRNRLGGPVPTELGGLANLRELKLGYNRLEGELPPSLTALPLLGDASLDLGYNMLTASDLTLASFLDAHDPDWRATQTVAPRDVTVAMVLDTVVRLAWTPIEYTGDGGHYEVWYATDPGGPYLLHGVTADKHASGYTLEALAPGTTYYIQVRSYTPAHGEQQNPLLSPPAEASEATTYTSFCEAVDELPGAECEALLALYDATAGASWTRNDGWLGTPSPCSWYGVVCRDGHVDKLMLQHNNLEGTLPPALGDMPELTWLGLYGNRLAGGIPAEVCALPKLTNVYLHNNALAGDIPAPFTESVTTLLIDYNMLEAADPAVQQYLDAWAPGWRDTQTVPPTNLRLGEVTPNAVQVLWDPIAYAGDVGWYEVLYGWSSEGPFAKYGETSDKTVGEYTIDGLVRPRPMYVVVRTVTEAHGEQPNRLVSRTSVPLEVPPSDGVLMKAFIPLVIR